MMKNFRRQLKCFYFDIKYLHEILAEHSKNFFELDITFFSNIFLYLHERYFLVGIFGDVLLYSKVDKVEDKHLTCYEYT